MKGHVYYILPFPLSFHCTLFLTIHIVNWKNKKNAKIQNSIQREIDKTRRHRIWEDYKVG